MEFLEKNWSLISSNPVAFIVFAGMITGFMWTVAWIYFSGQLASAKGQAELAQKQRDDLQNKIVVLDSAIAEVSAKGALGPEWDRPIEKRFRMNFKNETIDIDGLEFIQCRFESVTFRYQGKRPFRFHECKGNTAKLTTDNPVVGQSIQLVNMLRGKEGWDYDIFKAGSR